MPKSKHFILKKAVSAYFPQTLCFQGEEGKEEDRKGEREGNGWRGRNFFIRKGWTYPVFYKLSNLYMAISLEKLIVE